MNQSANLDLLRSFAVVMVFASHCTYYVLRSHLLESTAIGQMGVLIFFIHTSMVLMMSLERLHQDGSAATPRFYLRRAFRIYPLSVVTVLVCLLTRIPSAFDAYRWLGYPTIAANLLLINNFGFTPVSVSLWSLPWEVQMYLILPLCYAATRSVRSYRGFAIIIAVGFISWYLGSKTASRLGSVNLLQFAPWFAMGVSAYCSSRFIGRTWSQKGYVCCLILLAVSPFIILISIKSYRGGWAQWAVGVVFVSLLPRFREIESGIARKAAHLIARYSYGIYLSHMPILWFSFQYMVDAPLASRVATAAALSFAVPVMLYHFIEKPMIHLGARISDKMAETAPALALPATAQ